MPVFNLTKYDDAVKQSEDQAAARDQTKDDQVELHEQKISIHASDTVSKIVADALYKTLTKVEPVEQTDEEAPNTEVVSTEDINRSPADVWIAVKKAQTVVIVTEGFRTQREEWFLSVLQEQGKTVFYSMESYLASMKLKKVSGESDAG
jgi:hypothetical protein